MGKFFLEQKDGKTYITTHVERDAVWKFAEKGNEFVFYNKSFQPGDQKPTKLWLLDTPDDNTTAKFAIDFNTDEPRFTVASFDIYEGASTGDDATKIANASAHKKYIAKEGNADLFAIVNNKANTEELAKLATKELSIKANGKVEKLGLIDDSGKVSLYTLTTEADEADALKYTKAGESGNDEFMLKNGDSYINAAISDVKDPATDSLHYTVTEAAENAYTLTIKKGEQADSAKTTEVIKLADSITSVFKFNEAGNKVKSLKIGDNPEFTLTTETELDAAKGYKIADLAEGVKVLASDSDYIQATYTNNEKKYALTGVTAKTAYTLTIKDASDNNLETITLAGGVTTDTKFKADHTSVSKVKISSEDGVKTVKFNDSADTAEKVSIDLSSASAKALSTTDAKDAGGSGSDQYNAATNKLALSNLVNAELKGVESATIASDVSELEDGQFSKIANIDSLTAINAAQALKITAGETLDVSKVTVSSGNLTEATLESTTAITLKADTNSDVIDLSTVPTAKKLSITNFAKTADKVKIDSATLGTEISIAITLTNIKDADGTDDAKMKVDNKGIISFTKNNDNATTLDELKNSAGDSPADEASILAAIQTALNKSSGAGITNGVYLFNGKTDSYLISLGGNINDDTSDDIVVTLSGVNDATTVTVSSHEISLS